MKRGSDRLLFPAVTSLSEREPEGRFAVRLDADSTPDAHLYRGVEVATSLGVAYDSDGLVPASAGLDYHLRRYQSHQLVRRYPALPLRGIVAAINFGSSSHVNYFHRWVDVLPRAWVLGHVTVPGLRALVYVGPGDRSFGAVLRRLVPPNVAIHRLPRFVPVRPVGGFLYLPVPSRHMAPGGASGAYGLLPTDYLRSFRGIAEDLFELPAGGERKLYITRGDAAGRRLVNDSDVRLSLAREGFETIELSAAGVPAQARLFREAGTIVAQHGAGLTNLIYCRPGVRLLEIFNSSRRDNDGVYAPLAAQLGVVHQRLDLNGEHKDSDAFCDLDRLHGAVADLEAR